MEAFSTRFKSIPGPASSLTRKEPHTATLKPKKESKCFEGIFTRNKAWLRMVSFSKARTGNIAALKADNSFSIFAHLIVLVQEIGSRDNDASAVFSDPTGDIKGTIHHKVFDSPIGSVITQGAVLELSNVSVFRPSKFAKYLNIMPDSITAVYPVNGSDPLNITPTVQIAPIQHSTLLNTPTSTVPQLKTTRTPTSTVPRCQNAQNTAQNTQITSSHRKHFVPVKTTISANIPYYSEHAPGNSVKPSSGNAQPLKRKEEAMSIEMSKKHKVSTSNLSLQEAKELEDMMCDIGEDFFDDDIF